MIHSSHKLRVISTNLQTYLILLLRTYVQTLIIPTKRSTSGRDNRIHAGCTVELKRLWVFGILNLTSDFIVISIFTVQYCGCIYWILLSSI